MILWFFDFIITLEYVNCALKQVYFSKVICYKQSDTDLLVM